MNVLQTMIMLPCHGLADLPGQLAGSDADETLAMWTAAWHPGLIQRMGQLPSWCSADSLTVDRAGTLLLVPQAAVGWLSEDYLHDAEANGATVISGVREWSGHQLRTEVVREILSRVIGNHGAGHVEGSQPLAKPVDADLIADFYSFGYWYLQTELLSFQLRYSSSLDAGVVGEKIVAAAEAAVAGQVDDARRLLAAGFGILADECAHYYPVDAYLLDLTLVAKFNCDDGLRSELSSGCLRNIWMTGETLEYLAHTSPATLAMLRRAIDAGHAKLVGGPYHELPTCLVPRNMVARNLTRGREAFQTHLGTAPQVFASRRFGLAPALPGLLQSAGFSGAVHATFDDGRIPSLPARAEWRGDGDVTIPVLGKAALDASRPETALQLGTVLGQSIETDFVATIVLARWAGQRTDWFHDVERGWKF